MGNCLASHHRTPAAEDDDLGISHVKLKDSKDESSSSGRDDVVVLKPQETTMIPSYATKPSASPDPTEYSSSSTATSTEMTLSPVSPTSLLSPSSNNSNDINNNHNNNLLKLNETTVFSPMVSTFNNINNINTTNSVYYSMSAELHTNPLQPQKQQPKLSPPRSHPRRRNHALQARLEKANRRRMAYSSDASSVAACSIGDSSALSHRRSLSSRYSDASTLTTATSTQQQQQHHNNHELLFEASALSKAAEWAELELDDAVHCICLSRTKANLSKSSPPLHIASGTAAGTVCVREILDYGPVPAVAGPEVEVTTEDHDDDYSKKLGPLIQVQVSGRVRSMDFSPDGHYLAVGGDDGQCSVFRLQYQREADNDYDSDRLTHMHCVAEIPRIDRIYAVQFSPDSQYLAIGGFDGTVAIVATKDIAENYQPDPVAEIPRHGLVLTVDWSPDGRYLAIGGSDKCCAIVNTSASWKVFKEIKRTTSIQSVKWYPGTGRYLAIGASDVTIVVGRDSFATLTEIDVHEKDNQEDASVSLRSTCTSNASRSVYRTNAVCWSPNGSYFVVCGSDQKCTIFETHSFTTVHQMTRPANITSVVWGQVSVIAGIPRRYLAIGSEDHKVVILKAGLEVNPGTSSMGDDLSNAASSYFSKNSNDWVLRENVFRDVEEESITGIPEDDNINSYYNNRARASNRNSTVVAVTFSVGSKSKASQYFAYAADDGLVTVRFTTNWKVAAEIQFPQSVDSLAFSPDGRLLAIGCQDSNIYVSDTHTNWGLIAKIELGSPVTSVTFSRNGERLAGGSIDGTFALLNPQKDFEFCGEIESSESAVLTADWSSRNMAIGREDGTLTIYDANQVIDDFFVSISDIQRKSSVHAVAFGVSSRFLAVGTADGCVGIYSSKGNWVLCHQVWLSSCISAVRWSPAGRYLAYGSTNGGMKVVDTIFWADVVEAEAGCMPQNANDEDSKHPVSSISFSQDGQLLAFTRGDRATTVLNSLSNWNVDLSLAHSSKTTVAESSSLSSNEDHNGCEV